MSNMSEAQIQLSSKTTVSDIGAVQESHEYTLPDAPLLVIEPSRGWASIDIAELWRYRELLCFLTWRDVKVRYKQTVLGAAWVIIQPMCQMIIFTLLFGRLAGMDQKTGGVPYPIFAYAGLLPWTFFSNAVTNSGNSLVGSANLVTKVYFPRMIIPAAAVGAGLIDFAIAFALLVGLMIYYSIGLTVGILMLPVLVFLTTLLATGTGMLFSALNVKYRDVRYALPFVIQIWMFLSPIIYPRALFPERWRWILLANPLTGIIEGYRSCVLGLNFDWFALGVSGVEVFAILMISVFTFHRMEKSFADVV
jgi:lipopolysaccharide transport system permease protein